MTFTALIAKASDRIRKARAERYRIEHERGVRDAHHDYFDLGLSLAEMFDPTGLSRTPYNDGYSWARSDIRKTEAFAHRVAVEAAVKFGPRKWMPPMRPGERLVFSKERV